MLNKIKISSFKSIVNQEISLGMMNVFIGANGSGKSNFLEAIGVLSAAAAGRVDDEALQRRGIRLGTPRLYKSAFEEKIPPQIFFEALTDTAKYSVSLNNPLENPKPAWQYQTEELVNNQEPIVNRGPHRDIKNKEQGLAALKLVEADENEQVLYETTSFLPPLC